jgi:hypothetical protein
MKRAATRYCRRAIVAVQVSGLTFVAALGACGGPQAGPEEQLTQWVSNVQQAAESKHRRELLDMISPAYADARGFDRDDIGARLGVYFLRQHSITLLTSIEEIRLYGDSAAEVELTVAMAGKNDSVFGFSADAYRFQLELQRDGDDWLLISARWAELGEEPH